MELRIDQQYARIGLNIQKPQLNLKTQQPQINMNSSRPEVKIESPKPQITIDQRDCFKSYFKMNINDLTAYFADKGYQDCIEGIQRRVNEGHELASIEKGGSIAGIAVNKMDRTLEFAIKSLPENPPRIEAVIQPVQIDFIPADINIQFQRGSVENRFQWGKVNVYLEQQNYIKINWIDNKVEKVV